MDVLSMSFGKEKSLPLYEENIVIGSFVAVSRGTFISCAAGNDDPRMYSLLNTVGVKQYWNMKFQSKSLPPVHEVDQENDVEGKIIFSIEPPIDYTLFDTSGVGTYIEAHNNVSAYTISFSLFPDAEVLSLKVSNFAGVKIKTYINSTPNPVATISFIGTVLGVETDQDHDALVVPESLIQVGVSERSGV
ncbi:hypothetical protein CASFOL_012963 [Castilleja foliolosa]|uniref:Uncharacterized protein n=1 Tax=Castilleja foliolosa TaxID=1961234 RepID=A0ABD3DIL2_9LAMI